MLYEVITAVVKAAQELMSADIGLVGLVDENHKDVSVKAVIGAQTNLIRSYNFV